MTQSYTLALCSPFLCGLIQGHAFSTLCGHGYIYVSSPGRVLNSRLYLAAYWALLGSYGRKYYFPATQQVFFFLP